MMVFAFLLLPMMFGCGNDDDENGKSNKGESTIVDGVNVLNGKKLVELNVGSCQFKVQYDSKGRIIKVQRNRSWEDHDIEEDFVVVLEIDYDLRVFTLYDWDYSYKNRRYEYHPYSFGFALNNDGYISLLSNIALKYDLNGYLSSVDSPEGLATLSLANDDYLKASLSGLISGEIQLFYVTFGDIDDKGELYVRFSSNPQRDYVELIGSAYGFGFNKVLCLIMYQSGLFGKVTKSILHFKVQQEATAFFEYDSQYNYRSKIVFKYE